MIQNSVHLQQGKRNKLNSPHDEEAVVLPRGHYRYLKEASGISKTNRGREKRFRKPIDDQTCTFFVYKIVLHNHMLTGTLAISTAEQEFIYCPNLVSDFLFNI